MPFSSFELFDHSESIVVFGRDGQVGKALQVCLKGLKIPAVFLGHADCDLGDESSILQVLNRYQPQVIINAAAYTAVDEAESVPELAFAINAKAPELMARYIANVVHGVLVHYSTDYVFADTKTVAYLESDVTGPASQLSVYGQSKLAGEQAIEEAFNSGKDSRYFILRTSWVYGDGGNFIRTILHLASERDSLKVVDDQIGAPCSAQWLAEVGIQMAASKVKSGIYHAVPNGETSWHGLAVFAIKIASSVGDSIKVKLKSIIPLHSADYPLLVKRPYNSRMNNQKLKQALSNMGFTGQYPNWQDQVESYVRDYVGGRIQELSMRNKVIFNKKIMSTKKKIS